MTFYITWKKS